MAAGPERAAPSRRPGARAGCVARRPRDPAAAVRRHGRGPGADRRRRRQLDRLGPRRRPCERFRSSPGVALIARRARALRRHREAVRLGRPRHARALGPAASGWSSRGPYRYLRHPMISGVALVLAGEALVLGSPAIGDLARRLRRRQRGLPAAGRGAGARAPLRPRLRALHGERPPLGPAAAAVERLTRACAAESIGR